MQDLSYLCPGDGHAISRAVHLSRLAKGFSACGECVHAGDLGVVPLSLPPARRPLENRSVFQTDRIWAQERNRSERERSLAALGAVASLLWDDSPWSLPANEWDARDHRPPSPPTVCIGHDGAGASLRFCSDAMRLLLRWGCRVVSLGRINAACLQFAVDHLKTSVGICVESGESPAGVGLSLIGSDGHPWSMSGRLKAAAEQVDASSRPCRSGGSLRTFDVTTPYRAGIPRFFPETRSLEIGVLGMSEFFADCWLAIKDRVNCRMHPIAGSVQMEDGEPIARSVRPLMDAILKNRWSGGIILGRDGLQAWGVDRREGLMSSREMCRIAVSALAAGRRERPLRVIAHESTMWMDLNVPGVALSCCSPTQESLTREMERTKALAGADGAGRVWIGGPRPVCDAFQTIGSLLSHWSEIQQTERAEPVAA